MNFSEMDKPVEILVMEDNPGDVRLIKEVLQEAKVRNNPRVVGDGVEALSFLRREGEYAGAPRADLILLDPNLPNKGGREILAEIKADDELKNIPVVILTISNSEEDILKSYNLHPNCYIIKPTQWEQFENEERFIGRFWFGMVELPKAEEEW